MFDPYNPADVQMAREYEADIIQAMRENPHVGKGMSVEVLSDPVNQIVLYEGRVLSIEWQNRYMMYEAKVRIHEGDYKIFINCLRRSRSPMRDIIIGGK